MARPSLSEIATDDRITAYGRLVDAQRRLHRVFERSLRDETGISITWYEALLRLARSPDHRMPITELGDQLELTSGGATRLVDRLEQQGYLERVPCAADRRVHWAQLTSEGVAVLAAATEVHLRDLDEHFVGRLTNDELASLRDLLRKVRPGDD